MSNWLAPSICIISHCHVTFSSYTRLGHGRSLSRRLTGDGTYVRIYTVQCLCTPKLILKIYNDQPLPVPSTLHQYRCERPLTGGLNWLRPSSYYRLRCNTATWTSMTIKLSWAPASPISPRTTSQSSPQASWITGSWRSWASPLARGPAS